MRLEQLEIDSVKYYQFIHKGLVGDIFTRWQDIDIYRNKIEQETQ